MELRLGGMCRGDGEGYVESTLRGVPSDAVVQAIVCLEDGTKLPCSWRQDGGESSGCLRGVVVIPLVDARRISIVLEARSPGGDVLASCRRVVGMGRLKWASRVNYRLRGALCKRLRGACELSSPSTVFVRSTLCMPDGDDVVWRIMAEVADAHTELGFVLYDGAGHPRDVEPVLFEDQRIEGPDYTSARRLTMSYRLPRSMDRFFVEVTCAVPDISGGFFGMDPQRFLGELASAHERLRDASDADDYRFWRQQRSEGVSSRMKNDVGDAADAPLISVVVPCYQPDLSFLAEMVQSMLAQTYHAWELVVVDSEHRTSGVSQILDRYDDRRIRRVPLEDNGGIVGNTNAGISMASGALIGFLDYDDVLDPGALAAYAQAASEHPDAAAFYCDEDTFVSGGPFENPVFKTDFNRDLLYAHNCVTHFLVVRAEMFAIVGFSEPEVEGAQDYDLVLRLSETRRPIVHIPDVLYHWRMHAGSTNGGNVASKPHAHEAGKVALTRHFNRRGIETRVEDGSRPFVYRVCYGLPRPLPRLDVIIPSKDHAVLLECCIASILEKAGYENLAITVVENNSSQRETFECYERLEKCYRNVRVIEWQDEFNYSRIVNFGVHCTDGELVLLLNNDTEAMTNGFAAEMAGYLQRPEVGVVGAKLLFRDRLVQHAGMLIGPHGTVVHVNPNVAQHWGGYLDRAILPGNFSAVTGACQMVKRSVFEEVGGYTEAFAVGFNDADFCCKVTRAGYLVAYTPYAELFHYEFASRGREEGDPVQMVRWEAERTRMVQEWPSYFEQGDPFSNPNLDPDSLHFALPHVAR